MENLPDEILLKMFSFFKPEELSSILCNVCKRWRCVALDNQLWQNVSYCCNSETAVAYIKELLNFAPAIKSFSITARCDATILLKELCDKCEGLQRLELKCCNLGSEDGSLLLRIVTRYPNLQSLTLEGCQPLTTEALLQISSLQHLTTLKLPQCNTLRGDMLCYILEHCPLITELNIDHVKDLYDEDIMTVLQTVSRQLLVLSLDGERLTDAAYKKLQHCKRLTRLEISFCDQMTDEGLLQGIAPLEDLTFLRVEEGHMLSAGALSRFLNRPALSCLLHLNFSRCSSLDNSGLQGIAENCAKLQHLALRSCWKVTDEGVTSIVTHCGELNVLDIQAVVQVTGVGYFRSIPSCMPYLKKLNLQDCENICEKEVCSLVKNMPHLVVTDFNGYQFTRDEVAECERAEQSYVTIMWL